MGTQQRSTNAALAAAAAGRARPQHIEGNGTGTRAAQSPARGRSQLTLDLEQAARNLQGSASTPQSALAPPLSRTASEIAARAASASSSPARTSESAASRGSSPHKRLQASRSRDASILARGSLPEHDDALRGATLSMKSNPSQAASTAFSNGSGKLDLQKIPSLAASSSAGSSPPRPIPVGASSAAQTASKEAGARMAHAEKPAPAPSSAKPPLPVFKRASTFMQQPTLRSVQAHSTGPDSLHAAQRRPADDLTIVGSPKRDKLPLPLPAPRRGKKSPLAPGTPHMSPQHEHPGITATRLADAMVASSLASSRVQSPAPSSRRPKPPPLPHRRSRSLSSRDHKSTPQAPPLKPMTVRPMRQTLRKQSPKGEDDEDDKRGRKHRLRKHPNMHHEGDRKRWRDKITERERKRYEGVWAANRGLLHQQETADLIQHRSKGTLPEDLVINIVVRDIWDRCRLPRDVLEEVWDLVTDEESKSLNREEFVVGMWLIDQRLKGRKLPVKVSPSVWASVRHTQGVKISSKRL